MPSAAPRCPAHSRRWRRQSWLPSRAPLQRATRPPGPTRWQACLCYSTAMHSRRGSGAKVIGRLKPASVARFAVATELLAVLGQTGAPLAAPLLARMDEIASDAAAAEDAGDDHRESSDLAAARRGAEGALGAAVRSLGPEAVLDTLPLRLEEVGPPGLSGAITTTACKYSSAAQRVFACWFMLSWCREG
jgi:hypothetical protein